MDLIEDWLKLCNGEGQFNSSHFYTLFHYDYSSNELEKIFSCFEQKDELLFRYMNYKRPKNIISNEQLLELVKLDLNSKKEFCFDKGDSELVFLMESLNFQFVNSKEFEGLKNADLPHIWLMELIGDSQRYSYKDSIKNDAIIEAFYGLTSNNNLVWYLSDPLYNSKFNPNLYFNVWQNSGEYILGNKVLYILNGSNPPG